VTPENAALLEQYAARLTCSLLKLGDNPLYHPFCRCPPLPFEAMPGDIERLSVASPAAAPGATALAAELLGRVRAELPAVGELGIGSRSWWPRG
jgi:hypothetical protein